MKMTMDKITEENLKILDWTAEEILKTIQRLTGTEKSDYDSHGLLIYYLKKPKDNDDTPPINEQIDALKIFEKTGILNGLYDIKEIERKYVKKRSSMADYIGEPEQPDPLRETMLQIAWVEIKEKEIEKYSNAPAYAIFLDKKKWETWIKKGKREKESHKKAIIAVPPGTTWDKIKIVFINAHDVIIKAHGKEIYKGNYQTMGFEKGSTGKPDIQWEFLYDIADADNGGNVTKEILAKYARTLKKTQADSQRKVQQATADLNYDKNNPSSQNFQVVKLPQEFKNITQIKKRLADKFKEIFDIQEDPFYKTRKKETYRIKIQLEVS